MLYIYIYLIFLFVKVFYKDFFLLYWLTGIFSFDKYRNMKEKIKFFEKIKLKNPIMVAAWPGKGNVAFKAANYLKDKLDAKLIAELPPFDYYQLFGINIRTNIIEETKLPKSLFFAWQDPKGNNDILIFIGEAQPASGKELAVANLILKVAKKYKVETIVTFAAMPLYIDHKKRPEVFCAVTNKDLIEELTAFGVRWMNDGQITGMNGLILGIGKAEGFKGISFLGEIPFYTTQIENPKASMAILEIFCQWLKIDIDMNEIEQLANFTEKEIEKLIQEAKESQEYPLPSNEKKGPGYLH